MDFQQIIDYTKLCLLAKYADFSGRARRAEYWSYTLVISVIGGILSFLGQRIGIFNLLSYVFSIAVLVPGLAVAWRRLHDIGKKGTWYLVVLIPVVGWILLIFWYCQDSQPGTNEFGPNPKEGGWGSDYRQF